MIKCHLPKYKNKSLDTYTLQNAINSDKKKHQKHAQSFLELENVDIFYLVRHIGMPQELLFSSFITGFITLCY